MAQACPPDRAVAVGDIVDVKNYGRAEVIEPLVTDPSSRFCGRVRVRYQQDGKTYYVRPEALRKAIQVKQRVLLCHSTTHYRTCAASVINWDDAVLEVGSHEGECTWLMSRRCRYVVGVDKSEVTIAAARKRYPGLRFEVVDGFDVEALKALGPPDGRGFSVVLVDIGGIAGLPVVAQLLGIYYKAFPYTTKIIVKSVFLKRLVSDCLPYNPARNNPWEVAEATGGAGGRQGQHAYGTGGGTVDGEEEEQEEGEEGAGAGSGVCGGGDAGAGTEVRASPYGNSKRWRRRRGEGQGRGGGREGREGGRGRGKTGSPGRGQGEDTAEVGAGAEEGQEAEAKEGSVSEQGQGVGAGTDAAVGEVGVGCG